ncbi:Uncharacterised protein [Yersinia aleksiciae]|uniref:Uncharacterized protein n=1 Tax=Yersinia aleksiciae TaxID=263819 RepID=A0A0T9UNN1_YERAE|nr:Uncharacterised protein [Yersinia aleksiciae]CNL56555.1 Uncharacterised protein [Yersinia aleksiciae]
MKGALIAPFLFILHTPYYVDSRLVQAKKIKRNN